MKSAIVFLTVVFSTVALICTGHEDWWFLPTGLLFLVAILGGFDE